MRGGASIRLVAMWCCPFCGLEFEKDDFSKSCPDCWQRVNTAVRMVTEGFHRFISTHLDEVRCPVCLAISRAGSEKCKVRGSRMGIRE